MKPIIVFNEPIDNEQKILLEENGYVVLILSQDYKFLSPDPQEEIHKLAFDFVCKSVTTKREFGVLLTEHFQQKAKQQESK